MKSILLLCACLGGPIAWATQTSPPPASSPASAVSGTKNIGADRADAPQAPGMTTPANASPTPRKAKSPRKKAKL